MTTSDAFLAAIAAAPEDDLPRLVYADLLDEQSCPERAEFIRVQVRIAELLALGAHEGVSCNVTGTCSGCHRGGEVFGLRQRERVLWDVADQQEWFVSRTGIQRLGLSDPPYEIRVYGIVRRGFVDEVQATLADWCGGVCPNCEGRNGGYTFESPAVVVPCPLCHGVFTTGIGPAVVAAHPVSAVTLTDREPAYSTMSYQHLWVIDVPAARADDEVNNRCLLPQAVWKILPGWNGRTMHARTYPTREDAMSALSTSLIAWAKGTA